MKQEMIGWQCDQLDHMQIICTSLQTVSLGGTSSCNFLWARCKAYALKACLER